MQMAQVRIFWCPQDSCRVPAAEVCTAVCIGLGAVTIEPKIMWASAEKLRLNGIYLLENGDELLLWVGTDVDEVCGACYNILARLTPWKVNLCFRQCRKLLKNAL